MTATSMRPVRFMGDSREVLRELPDEVKSEIGFALERVQQWQDAGECETPEEYCAGRAGDCVRLQRWHVPGRVYSEVPEVYVLHVFQKKSKRGIATPKREIDLVKRRLRKWWIWKRNRKDHDEKALRGK
jgi:phage-related protein